MGGSIKVDPAKSKNTVKVWDDVPMYDSDDPERRAYIDFLKRQQQILDYSPENLAYGTERKVGQPSFGAVTPFSPVSAPQASQSGDVAKMRDSILSSMPKSIDRAPQYKSNLEMPTLPKSANIPFERSISNRSTSGAGLQDKISPDDFLQAALRRYAARRG